MKPYYETKMGKLYHGNCLDIMPSIGRADLIITSPPYNMQTRTKNGKYTTRKRSDHFSKKYKSFGDALSVDDYYSFHKKMLEEMLKIAPVVFWNIQIVTGSKEAVFRIIGTFHKKIKDIVVWDKGFGQPAINEGVLNRGYELILILESNARAGRCFNKSCFKRGTMPDIWRIGRGKSYNENSACFPVGLVMQILEGWSCAGASILDPFFGSGTVGIACEKMGRNWTGIEITKECCALATSRIRAEASQLKLFA